MLIDFHSHILPGADHGCENVQTALKQLEYAAAADVDFVAATPHFYAQKESLEAFLQRRHSAVELLKSATIGLRLPTVVVGAEVFLCVGLENMEDIRSLCIGNSDTILIEMPFTKWRRPLIETLVKLEEERGLNVVIAHLDRYAHTAANELLNYGFVAQLNTDAFSNLFYRKRLLRWVNGGYIAALGSDIHGCERDYTTYTKTLKLLGDRSDRIMLESERLLNTKSVYLGNRQ